MKITRYPSSRLIGRVCAALLTLGSLTANAQQGETGTAPRIISFTKAEGLKANDAASILAKKLQIRAGVDELRSAYVEKPGDGLQVQRFLQYFKGIKVAHGSYTLTSKDGIASYAFGEYYNIPAGTSITPAITEADALKVALADVGAKRYIWDADPASYPKGELQFVQDFSNEAAAGGQHLAFAFDIYAEEPLSRNMIYVDAKTGKILFVDAILKHVSATGASLYSDTVSIEATIRNGKYVMHDQTRGGGIITYDLNNTTSTSVTGTGANPSITQDSSLGTLFSRDASVDAHWGATKVYDYWKNTHNRLSWNGTNGILRSFVHYGNNYANAMWNGSSMVYGDGSAGSRMSPLTTLDICGHEIGHGVCASTAGLVYSRESGAMNEGFSDIWGSVIEAYGDPHETDAVAKNVWLMGEETGNTLRSLKAPKTNSNPDTYLGKYWVFAAPNCAPNSTTNDNCGVHTNSGVLNYWFYLMCEGGKGTNDLGDNYKVIPIGMAKAAKIAYATELALGNNSRYADCRLASIAAATALYGACSAEVEAVTRAWYAVGVGTNFTPCTPEVSFTDVSSDVSEDGIANVCKPTHIVSVPVVLNGPALAGGNATVTASVIGGTAVAGVDYTLTNPVATFTVGGPATSSISLTVNDNGTINSNKYVDLVFTLTAGSSNAIKSAVLDTTRVFIANDDNAPLVGGTEQHAALANTGSAGIGSPFMSGGVEARAQYIYKASELRASAVQPNAPITQADIFVTTKNSTQPFSNYTLKIAHTSATSLANGYIPASFTTVHTSNYTTALGWNALPFSTPFVWNDTDNIIVEVCFTNTSRDIENDRVQSSMGSYTLSAYSSFTFATGTGGCNLGFNVNNLTGTRPVLLFTQDIPPTPIATTLNDNRIWDVKSGQQVYFYTDNASGRKLIAGVFGPTADLGCVTATVTKAGNNFFRPAVGKVRSVKEFSIATATPVTSPSYDAIIYMTKAEMAGIDPTKIQIVQSSTTHDSEMTASNTVYVTPNDIIYGLDYFGFRGTFNGFGRFFLSGDNLGLAVGGVKSATSELWTGANPFQAAPVLHWNLPMQEKVAIRIYDVTGKVVYSSERTLEAGSHQTSLSGIADYAPGSYVLQVVRPSGVFTRQMVKQ